MSVAIEHQDLTGRPQTFLDRLNSGWHERALQVFAFIVLGHWAEHVAQAIQIYGLGRKPPQALGLLGSFAPWLIRSESLHYGYAIVMLIGLWTLRRGFVGTADRRWWTIALAIQFWHHVEHALLLAQAIFKHNFFGRPVPTSILQLWFPRVELHLFYNAVVFIPMSIGMYYHLFPKASEAHLQQCTCAVRPRGQLSAAGGVAEMA